MPAAPRDRAVAGRRIKAGVATRFRNRSGCAAAFAHALMVGAAIKIKWSAMI
jgi:hypothetical protein